MELLAGFRGDSLSLYFGEDPVFHFNAAGELRRAFIDGRLVKADRGRLVFMEREQTDQATILQHTASAGDEEAVTRELAARLRRCEAAMTALQFTLLGESPVGGDGVSRLLQWLRERRELVLAQSPHVT